MSTGYDLSRSYRSQILSRFERTMGNLSPPVGNRLEGQHGRTHHLLSGAGGGKPMSGRQIPPCPRPPYRLPNESGPVDTPFYAHYTTIGPVCKSRVKSNDNVTRVPSFHQLMLDESS